MRSHDELAACLMRMFPGSHQGTDFLVGHEVAPNSPEQLGEAFIMQWYRPEPQPTPEEIEAAWAQHGDGARADVAEFYALGNRKAMIAEATEMIGQYEDKGNSAKEAEWRTYRKALRDVPTLPGFPMAFSWPVKPGG